MRVVNLEFLKFEVMILQTFFLLASWGSACKF